MEKDKDLMPGQEEEEKEKEEDETEEQKNKRILVDNDITSEKTDDKAPAALTDPSADKLFDEEPRRKALKLVANQPRSSLDKESPKKPIKLIWKYSRPSPKVGPESSNDKSHKSRELGHVRSGAVGGSGSTDAKATMEQWPSLGHLESLESFESLPCEDKNFEGKSEGPVAESAELAQIRSPLTEACLESHRAYLESLKADKKTDAEPFETHKKKPRSKRKQVLRWTDEEVMLLFLKDELHMLMVAVCALHRHAMITHMQMGPAWLPDSTYAKVTHIAEFLTADDVYGPCRRTPDDLERIYRGASAYCSWFVCTYSKDLYEIYLCGFDEYFR